MATCPGELVMKTGKLWSGISVPCFQVTRTATREVPTFAHFPTNPAVKSPRPCMLRCYTRLKGAVDPHNSRLCSRLQRSLRPTWWLFLSDCVSACVAAYHNSLQVHTAATIASAMYPATWNIQSHFYANDKIWFLIIQDILGERT